MKKFIFLLIFLLSLSIYSIAQVTVEIASQPKQLTPEDEYFMRPAWSSNGQFLAFTTQNYHGIWVMALATGNVTKLVEKEGSGYKFAWSPDGLYIVYRARNTENKKTKHSIELVQIHTKEVEIIEKPSKRVGTPQWAHNNSSLFYTINHKLKQYITGIFTASALKKPLPRSDKYLAFLENQKLQLAPLKDTLDHRIHLPLEKVINYSLSPNSRKIMYEVYGGDLTIFDLFTGKSNTFGKGYRAVWSPDGNWVSYMVTEDDGHTYLSSDIVIARVNGENVIKITKTNDLLEMNPAWSPDGLSLAFDEHKTGIVYEIDLNL